MAKIKNLHKKAGKLGVTQSKMKSALRDDIALYIKYRQLQKAGYKCKAFVTLQSIRNKQAEINEMRRAVGLRPIRFYQELKQKLKLL